MCGIFGTSNLTPTTRAMMPFLAWAMEDRGRDSWGCTNGEEVLKKLGAITDSWELPAWERGIFHTRAGSVGAKTVENAHPFEFVGEAGHVIGIHNGCLYNHEELNRKRAREFQVDSMHIFANIAEGLPTKELEGWGACAWYQDGVLKLWRFHMESLHLVRLETGELVFASTYPAISKAARMCGTSIRGELKLDETVVYSIRPHEGGWAVFKDGEMKTGSSTRKATYMAGGGDYYGGTDWHWRGKYGHYDVPRREKFCFHCKRVEVDRKKKLLCEECLTAVLQKVGAYQGVKV